MTAPSPWPGEASQILLSLRERIEVRGKHSLSPSLDGPEAAHAKLFKRAPTPRSLPRSCAPHLVRPRGGPYHQDYPDAAGCSAAVARLFWEQEVGGSIPPTPTSLQTGIRLNRLEAMMKYWPATVQESIQDQTVDLWSRIGTPLVDTVRPGWAVTKGYDVRIWKCGLTERWVT